MGALHKELVSARLQALQASICSSVEALDGTARFQSSPWKRTEGGGGHSCSMENGTLIEKGGVNFACVHGDVSPAMKQSFGLKGNQFFATGLSIVLHPINPFVPIIHMNTRYFELDNQSCWFGGGMDLTPHYLCKKEAALFHLRLKELCDAHKVANYAKYKAWADDYFFLPHRQETRGIGGIFYDRIGQSKPAEAWAFTLALAQSFVPLYASIVAPKRHQPYTQQHQQWQWMRRGRYVEFNLLYDLGTQFGLQSNGRIASIFMSLPPHAIWPHHLKIKPNSAEEQTLKGLKKGVNWITHATTTAS